MSHAVRGDAAGVHSAPRHQPTTRTQERLMSWSWFVGLHVPILYTLCTGNTTLAWSIWPASFFDLPPDPNASSSMAPLASHPQPHSAWYPLLFFTLLAATALMYFTAALSYPGYVDEEYKRSKADGSLDVLDGHRSAGSSGAARGRNGYARVDGADSAAGPLPPADDVRIDMRPIVRRILVDEAAASPVEADSGIASPSIPASAIGEAGEAADLATVGCAPPIALPMLQSLGLSRAQIHASDQTSDVPPPSDQIPDQTHEIPLGEDEMSRLTPGSNPSEVELGNVRSSGTNAPAATAQPRRPTGHATGTQGTHTSGYCQMCRLVRPARSKHCYKCRHCITKFDHHCPFLGGCVGGKNHRYFLIYLWCQVMTMIWGLTLNTEPYLYAYTTKAFYGHACIMIIMVGQLMISGMLCMFHSWLAVTNQTTYQVIKMQDSVAGQHPAQIQARRMRRRQQNRADGEPSSEDEEDDQSSPNAPPLTWSTYHVGFFWNLFTFFTGQVPDQHRLPRSILDVDDGSVSGTWKHLPHAIDEVEVVRREPEDHAVGQIADAERRSMQSTERDAAATVQLQYHGRALPTNAAEVAAFPDTPPTTEPREAYTRPTRIIGHSKVQLATAAEAKEPDTDEEQLDSVEL